MRAEYLIIASDQTAALTSKEYIIKTEKFSLIQHDFSVLTKQQRNSKLRV
jgi:hypothetical protein